MVQRWLAGQSSTYSLDWHDSLACGSLEEWYNDALGKWAGASHNKQSTQRIELYTDLVNIHQVAYHELMRQVCGACHPNPEYIRHARPLRSKQYSAITGGCIFTACRSI